jgi:acyl-CoA synthetase (AMP-forming)/AMP-acid ligase II
MHPPKAIICPPKAHLLRLVSPALRRIPCKFSTTVWVPGAVSLEHSEKMAPYSAIHTAGEDEPALITFTSGSTGQPKMVIRSHGFLLAQHRVLQATMGMKTGDINLSTLPIVVLTNLAAGATSLIPNVDLRRPGDIDPEAVYTVIARHQPGSATAAPSFLETLSDYCIERGRQLPGLTGIFCGGAPVFPPLLKKLRAIAPAAKIVAVYGSTEAEPIAELSFADISAEDMVGMSGGKGLLAGSPVEPIQLRIIRDRWGTSLGPFSLDEFEGLALPSGEPGEIVVTGNHVLKGYLNGQGDRETKFTVDKATWHRTGDSGYLDNRGRLWLLGRCEAVLSDDRGKLYPFAVESTAQLLPGIQRAALVSDCGKRTLVVEPAKAAARIDSAAIKQKLSWAQIDSVKICRKIPVDRRHNSKIDYERLRRILRSLGSEA